MLTGIKIAIKSELLIKVTVLLEYIDILKNLNIVTECIDLLAKDK